MTTATTVNVQFQLRADTAANWTAANPILLANEFALETDTKKLKVGDGTTAWASLAYFPSIVTGGTVLGNLEIGSTGTLTFEGSTADGFETTLAVTDPTADRTITLPDQSGTVVVSGNASIVDADIAAGAEIAVSKLANGTANQVLVTDGTDVSWSNDLTIAGDLTVNGTTTTVNTETLLVEDKNIELGVVDTPTDVTADGGGITLKGTTDKTINWVDATDAWTSSENINLANGKSYRINDTEVLSATTLGSGVTSSSLTSVGTLGSVTVTGDATAGTFIPTGGTAPTNGLYLPATNSVALSTNGTGRISINADGDVDIDSGGVFYDASTNRLAIGTTSPATPLHIGSSASGGYFLSDDGTNARVYISGSTSLAELSVLKTNAAGWENFEIKSLSTVFKISNTERARIDSSGRLLVGTSAATSNSPSGSLIVQDRIITRATNLGVSQVIVDEPGAVSPTTGTVEFTFQSLSASAQYACYVKLQIALRTGNNTATNLPVAEYAFQLHNNSSGVCTINGLQTVFEYGFTRATHFAFTNLGSGQCKVTLTNPTAGTAASASKVEILTCLGAWYLSNVTAS